jgi:cysteine desulfurase
MRKIYLDHNATTPINKFVARTLEKSSRYYYGNPSSPYDQGKVSRLEIEKARGEIAKFINCDRDELIFTSGGTESNNLAIIGSLNTLFKKSKKEERHIITSQIEHLSVLSVFRELEKRSNGFKATYLPVDRYGFVDLNSLESSIDKHSELISIMFANNEIGTIQPIKEMVKRAKSIKENIIFHCDAVQALGKTKIDVRDLGVDLLSLSSHKIYGPKGVGALYIKKGVEINPIFYGGHQEKGIRPGTENVYSIIGFGLACNLSRTNLDKNIAFLAELKKYLMNMLLERLKEIIDIRIINPENNCLPNTLGICFKGVDNELLISLLNEEGIYISSGSACTSESLEPSYVLLTIGLSPELARNTVRISLGIGNTKKELEIAVEKIKKIILKNKLILKESNRNAG